MEPVIFRCAIHGRDLAPRGLRRRRPVDTHDDLKVTPDMPDYDAWRGIREYNAELKTEVERAWTEAGLPTNEDLCAIMEDMADQETPRQGSSTPGPLVLVVDDEQDETAASGGAAAASSATAPRAGSRAST